MLFRSRRGLTPCPVCGAELRGREDRRAPVSLYRRGEEEAWHCKAGGCGAGGGSAALLAAIRFGIIPPKGDPRWAEVMAELDGAPAPPPTIRRRRPPEALQAPIATETVFPPVSEVNALWSASTRLRDQIGRAHV